MGEGRPAMYESAISTIGDRREMFAFSAIADRWLANRRLMNRRSSIVLYTVKYLTLRLHFATMRHQLLEDVWAFCSSSP